MRERGSRQSGSGSTKISGRIRKREPLKSYSDTAFGILSHWLDLPKELMIEALGRIRERKAYDSFFIPKAGLRGWREILDPYGGLKEIQRRILHRLLYPIPVSEAAHGAVPGRSVVSNARHHLPEPKELFLLDIKDAFPSVRFSRVYGIFHRFVRPVLRRYSPLPPLNGEGLNPLDEAVHLLTSLCTYPRPIYHSGKKKLKEVYALPQGAPTSGYLLNLACLELDAQIFKIISKHPKLRLRYSRYLDDLSISSPVEIPSKVREEIELAVIKSDFTINQKKLRIVREPEPLVICGVQIRGEQVSADPKILERSKLLLEKYQKPRPLSKERKLRKKVRGIIAFFKQIYGEQLPPEIAELYSQYRQARGLPPEEPKDTAKPADGSSLLPARREPSSPEELLALWIDIPVEDLQKAREILSSQEAYQLWKIPKNNGSFREISSPHPHLKWIQERILTRFLYHIPVSGAAHGFVPGRSIVTNALVHRGAEVIFNLDLKDAFPSVSRHRVELTLEIGLGRLIKRFGLRCPSELRREVISLLAELLTYRDQLPQGAPTSGYLLNLAAASLDRKLLKLLEGWDIKYTRYADDLTFSSKGEIPQELREKIKKTIRKSGFLYNPQKTRYSGQKKGQRLEVCGLILDRDKLRIPREKMRTYRSIIRQAAKVLSPEELTLQQKQRILGIVGFVEMVYGELPPTLAKPYCEYLQKHPDSKPKRLYPDSISFYPNVLD